MSNLALLDRAASATSCEILRNIGSGLIQASVVPLWTPKGQLLALGAGAATTLAANYLCNEFDVGSADPAPLIDGCQKVDGTGILQFNGGDGIWRSRLENGAIYSNVKEITATTLVANGLGYNTLVSFIDGDGVAGGYQTQQIRTEEQELATKWRLQPNEGSTCEGEGGGPQPLPPGYDTPVEYIDEVTNCTYNVSLEGFAQYVEGGQPSPVFKIEGSGQQQRAGGGRAGGCNFDPVIYAPNFGGDGNGGGGGGVYLPIPDGPPPVPGPGGLPWWAAPLAGAVAGALLNQIGRITNDTFNYPTQAGAFTLTAPCDTDEQGAQLTNTWDFPSVPLILRIHDHQVAMMGMLQQHLNWKTPTCSSNEKPPLEGQWVTTRWESVEKMAHSGVRLRKLLRYRTKSTRNLGQLSAYWETFTWQAGDVCVYHKGAWWGTPQVWAASEEEGQRVLRFAAAEAGLDPDQAGEWGVSSSRSPRYGMSGTMKIHLKEGFPWVSSRDGASWPNVLAKQHNPYAS